MMFLVFLTVAILVMFLLNYSVLKETESLATNEKLDKQTEDLPSNEEICIEVQTMLGSSCSIQLDDKVKSSAYIYFLNKIILSNTESSKKNYSRVLFITHECVHSVQDKMTHKINFGLANLKNLYDIILLTVILIGKCSWELILLSFLISILSFYCRIILETDAVYRSVIYSRKYLEKRNMSSIADKYEEIVPKTIKGMYFSYLMPVLIRMFVMVGLFVIRCAV